MLARDDVEVFPVSGNHLVLPIVVMMPGAHDETGRCDAQQSIESGLVIFRPAVVVVDVTAEVRRITIDDVVGRCFGYRLTEILATHEPLSVVDDV